MGATEQSVPVEEASGATTGSGTGAEEAAGTWGQRHVGRRFVNDAAYVRLRSELAAAEPEFDLLVERANATKKEWAKTGRKLLRDARSAMGAGAIDEAWRHLHTARRIEVFGLEDIDEANAKREDRPRSEVQIRAAAVREEALDSLGGWRRRAVIDLLCEKSDGTGLKENITGSELRRASRILDEQHEDVHLARSERQRQFNALVVMATLAGLALFALSLIDWAWTGSSGTSADVAAFVESPFGPAADVAITSPGFAVSMTVAGVMGAALFGMRSLRKQSLSTKIPQQVSKLTVTSARAVIGAISALVFYFALQAPALDGTVLSPGLASDPMTMMIVAFAAGYTERLAPDVVSKVSSITGTDESGSK